MKSPNDAESTVVFVCGFLSSRQDVYLQPLLDGLSRAVRHLVVAEFPRQDIARRVLTCTLEEAVQAVVELTEGIRASRVILTGQSLGATVAMLSAATLLDSGSASRVGGVICFSPILSPASWLSEFNYEFLDDPRAVEAAESREPDIPP